MSSLVNVSGAKPLQFFVAGILWLLLGYFCATGLLPGPLWQTLLAVVLFSLPFILLLLHDAAVGKVLRRQRYQPGSLMHRFFSGRLLALLVALVSGWIAALFILLRMHVYSDLQWFCTLLTLPAFWFVLQFWQRKLTSEYKPFVLRHAALRWARLCTPVVLTLVCLPVLIYVSNSSDNALIFSEHVAAQVALVADLDGNATVKTLSWWMQVGEGLKQGSWHGPWEATKALSLLFMLLETWLQFYLVCTLLSSFTFTSNDVRRSLGPLTDAETVPPLGFGNLALLGAVSSFVLGFVLIPLASYTELWANSHRPILLTAPEELVLRLEKIGDEWYRPGTRARLADMHSEALERLDLSVSDVEGELDEAFTVMENNTGLFLDWYYSLGGEYSRIASLLTGNLDQYMADKLAGFLQQGDPFVIVELKLRKALAVQQEVQARYSSQVSAILIESKVDPGQIQVRPLEEFNLSSVLEPPAHQDLLGLQTRLLAGTGTGAAAGLMTSAIAAKLVSRIIAKGSFKLAVKAFGKALASKAAGGSLGAGAGAVTGGSIGSVIPGVGTAVGAVIGGIAGGILAGVVVDKALIELEEAISRESFQAELIDTIRAARQGIRLAP